MTPNIVLNEDGIEHLKAVIHYNWGDERRDYETQIAEGNDASCHVFVSLVALDNLVNGTHCAPTDYVESDEEQKINPPEPLPSK